MTMLLRDIRYGLRVFRKHAVLAGVVVCTLGVGLGFNTAVFSVVRAVLMRPLPFADDERLVRIYDAALRPGEAPSLVGVSRRNFHALREQSRLAESVTAQRYRDLTLQGDEGPERIVGVGVSEDWLSTLGVRPIHGRDITLEEALQGDSSDAVLISYAFWQSRLGNDPNVLGRKLDLDGRSTTVVGVLPSGFNYPYGAQLWFPLTFDRHDGRSHNLNVQVRLRPDVSQEQFQQELATIAQGLALAFPDSNRGYALKAVPIREVLLGDQHRVILALFAAVIFLLLIVAMNVASLLLTHAATRRQEFAIRAALGGGRRRQTRQILTEGVLLASGGGLLAIGLALWGVRLLSALIPPAMATLLPRIPIDTTVLGYALVSTVIAGLGISLAPALQLPRARLGETLNQGGSGQGVRDRRHRLHHALVVTEIALALTILAGATLMGRAFLQLQGADLGFSTDQLLTMTVVLPEARYTTSESRTRFVEQALSEVRAVPGVRAAGVTNCFPLPPENTSAVVAIQGRPRSPEEQLIVNHRLVSAGFLLAMAIPVVQGREIDESDTATGQPTVVVSQSMAKRYWREENPIGRQVAWMVGGEQRPWMTIVGIANDIQEPEELEDTWYLPYAQHGAEPIAEQVIFTLRTAVPPTSLARGLRRAVWRVDATLPVFDLAPVEQQYATTIAEQRVGAVAFGIFSIIGVLLAVLGIYGLLSHLTGKRSREIGIRMALGAQRYRVLFLIGRQGAWLVATGVLLGTLGALLLNHYLCRLFPEALPLGPAVLTGLALILTLAALVAGQIPALRATRIDPTTVLRME